ncbi:MAG: hypothetical protein Q7J06_03685 [Bacteroidales bacterium]|nr:hypothetical protein [Bacteroidales bacterium]
MPDLKIAGMMKRRIENYKEIVKALLDNQELSEQQKQFLQKEKIND